MRRVIVGFTLLALAGCGFIERSSVDSSQRQADGGSVNPAVSGDGHYVAFESGATNLVPGDTNTATDVFVRDHGSRTTQRVSVSTAGGQANGASRYPAVSADAGYVAFHSSASNLVAGDTNGVADVFVRDRTTSTNERMSIATGGGQGNGAVGNEPPSVSSDGRYVAFVSAASNLTSGDTNGVADVFVRDRVMDTTERVSIATDETQATGASAHAFVSGGFVAFTSVATNLVAGDTNATYDVFLRDLSAGTTERVSIGSGGEANQASLFPSASGDGRYVAFSSFASTLVATDGNGAADVFVRDRTAGTTERVSLTTGDTEANGHSLGSSISDDGRYVAFTSGASNLAPGDTNSGNDVFVRDLGTGRTSRASRAAFGEGANAATTGSVSLSYDGKFVAFSASATNLVGGDTNAKADVFLRAAHDVGPLASTGSTSVARGTTGRITLAGSWFDPTGLQVTVEPPTGITVDQISVASLNDEVELTITVAPDATIGPRELRVANPGTSWNPGAGSADRCLACLVIDEELPIEGTLEINGNEPSTSATAVALGLTATGPQPITEMRIADGADPAGAPWEPFTTTKPWTLPAGDGTKTVAVQFRDAGARISGTITDTIALDTTGPSASLQINGDDDFTSDVGVTLTTGSSDANGVAEMRVADGSDPTSATWEPYVATKPWTLPAGAGTKTVSAQYRDAAGNLSATAVDVIILDPTPPPAAPSVSDTDVSTTRASYDLEGTAPPGSTVVVEGAILPQSVVVADDGSFRVDLPVPAEVTTVARLSTLLVNGRRSAATDVSISQTPPSGGAIVEGTVVDFATGAPVGDATVRYGSRSVTTEGDGTFALPGMAEGDLTLIAQAAGFLTGTTTVGVDPVDGASGARIEVTRYAAPVTVGPAGGVVTSAGGVQLTVPAGALPSPTDIHLTDRPAPLLVNTERLGYTRPVVDVSPTGLVFSVPATLRIPLNVARPPGSQVGLGLFDPDRLEHGAATGTVTGDGTAVELPLTEVRGEDVWTPGGDWFIDEKSKEESQSEEPIGSFGSCDGTEQNKYTLQRVNGWVFSSFASDFEQQVGQSPADFQDDLLAHADYRTVTISSLPGMRVRVIRRTIIVRRTVDAYRYSTSPADPGYDPFKDFSGEHTNKKEIIRLVDEPLNCDPPSDPGTGAGWGDPHLVSFDGLRYDFQGAGEYTLLASEPQDLEVQVRQRPYGESGLVSVNSAVAIGLDDDRFGFYSGDAGADPFLVNGQAVALSPGDPTYVSPNNTRVSVSNVFNGASGVAKRYLLTWDSTARQVSVSVFPWGVNVVVTLGRNDEPRGLLGDFDGSRANDFQLRDGTQLTRPVGETTFYDVFGESWRVNAATSLFDYLPGETTDTFTDRSFPASFASIFDLDPAVRAAAEQLCRSRGVTSEPWLTNCILDVGLSGDLAFADGAAVTEAELGPTPPPPVLAGGGVHTCAVVTDGGHDRTVKCWGGNQNGQLGDPTYTAGLSTHARNVAGLFAVTAIAAGDAHTCGLLETGAVRCWGAGTYGQLGNGANPAVQRTPVDTGLTGVAAIAAGDFHTCALLDAGTVKCWGNNDSGRLGDGTSADRSTPVDVSGLTGVTGIAAGGDFTCASLANGSVRCWGNSHSSAHASSLTPVPVAGVAGASGLDAGRNHVCALITAGAVRCWGDDSSGQLGDGSGIATTAVTASGVTGATAIATGASHTCALLGSGAVRCWGINNSGQVGDDTLTNRSTPTEVVGLSGVALGAGEQHSCALVAGGEIRCWGRNSQGQLGNGNQGTARTPVVVLGIPEIDGW